MANMRIDGEKIYLTPISDEDLADFVRWRNSQLVRERYIYRGEFTIEGQKAWIKSHVDTGEAIQYIIWDKQDDKRIGCVYIQDIDNVNHKGEYGIFIGEEDYLGGGRGREAAELIVDYAFSHLSMHKIYLRVLSDNIRAYKSYEHAGFVKEGLFHDDVCIDGLYHDVIFMARYKD